MAHLASIIKHLGECLLDEGAASVRLIVILLRVRWLLLMRYSCAV